MEPGSLFYLLPLFMLAIGIGAAFLFHRIFAHTGLSQNILDIFSDMFGIVCACGFPILLGSLPWRKKDKKQAIADAIQSNVRSRQIISEVINAILKANTEGKDFGIPSFSTSQIRQLKIKLNRCKVWEEDPSALMLMNSLKATMRCLSAIESAETNVCGLTWEQATKALRVIYLRLINHINTKPFDDPSIKIMAGDL